MHQQTLKELKNLTTLLVAKNGLSLSELQVGTNSTPIKIYIQIQHENGQADVSLEECAHISELIGEALERSNLIKDAYVLEVSSPGISDQLINDRDFTTFKGFPVEVIYKDKQNSEQKRKGLLHQRSSNHVHINIKGRMRLIPRIDVTGVRLIAPTG